jgi:hypothetical protein
MDFVPPNLNIGGKKSSSRNGVLLALKNVLRFIRFIKLKRKHLSPLFFVELLDHSLFQQFTIHSKATQLKYFPNIAICKL